jgi:hypothetical protein
VTEQVFSDAETNVEGFYVVSAKQYIFWSSLGLSVTGEVDEHEPESVRLLIESRKMVKPSLRHIMDRAEYQALRLKHWRADHTPAIQIEVRP